MEEAPAAGGVAEGEETGEETETTGSGRLGTETIIVLLLLCGGGGAPL